MIVGVETPLTAMVDEAHDLLEDAQASIERAYAVIETLAAKLPERPAVNEM